MGGFAAALSILFFPFVIPGMLLSPVVRERSGPWILGLAALLIVVTWRMIVGSWIVRIGGDLPGEWPVELMRVVVNWAFGSIGLKGVSSRRKLKNSASPCAMVRAPL